jgi:uncharacterized LabA/DUF88 family protein
MRGQDDSAPSVRFAAFASAFDLQTVRTRSQQIEEFMLNAQSKTALFIDGANLHATAKALGFDIDFKKLLKEMHSRGNLLRAFYYAAILEDQAYSSVRPLVDWLDYNGYTAVTKLSKEYVDAAGRRKIKSDMDIELAVGAMEIAAHVDEIVSVLRERQFPLPGGSAAASRRAGNCGLHHRLPAADDRGRVAPPGRQLCRSF